MTDASLGSAVDNRVTSPCMFALTCLHRSQSWPFFCKHTAGHLPMTMNTSSLLPPQEVPVATLFHHLALGHSQIESEGQLTLQAQRRLLTVTTCLNCRAGAMPTSWALAHLVHSHITPSHSSAYRAVSCFHTPLPHITPRQQPGQTACSSSQHLPVLVSHSLGEPECCSEWGLLCPKILISFHYFSIR